MIEDDIYRTSTQYRYWSYTPTQLQHLRATTNALASARVQHAIQRATGSGDIPTLTPDEELRIVNWGCAKILEIGASIKPHEVPMEIRCTAIQYLRRFYLTNSPMTYHPKQIMTCALYLATKSSHWHVSIGRYVAELDGVTEALVKGPEFLLLQGLRFTLDVRHAVKGLEGTQIELVQLSRDRIIGASERAINDVVKRARDLCRGPAQMTDVYFLYTPAQIAMAALRVVDADLCARYLEQKVDDDAPALAPVREKLVATVAACAEILAAYASPEEDPAAAKEMRRIGKKLHLCQNPEKAEIVAATAEAKVRRDGEDSERDEKKAKKRKLEREMREKDADVFGGELRNIEK